MKSSLFFTIILLTSITELRAQNTNQNVQLNGFKQDFHPNGKVQKEYYVSNGVVNGNVKTFTEEGVLTTEQNFVEGVQQGIQKTFYKNGKVHMETNMVNGQPQGLIREYFESGKTKYESSLTGNPWEFSGQTRQFYENGYVRTESVLSMGKLESSITYDKEGRVIFEEKDGLSKSYSYDRDGKRHVSIDGKPQD
jgi:antitoxin component YwqK of YwqJK toxin-antitoxin module